MRALFVFFVVAIDSLRALNFMKQSYMTPESTQSSVLNRFYAYRRMPRSYYNPYNRYHQHVVYFRNNVPVKPPFTFTGNTAINHLPSTFSMPPLKVWRVERNQTKPLRTHFQKNKTSSKRNFVSSVAKEVKNVTSNDIASYKRIFDKQRKEITEAASKKDNVVGRYFSGTIDSDFLPFDGNRHNYLTIKEEDDSRSNSAKPHTKSHIKTPVIEGASDKEVVYSTAPEDSKKPIEFFLTENRGDAYRPELPLKEAVRIANTYLPIASGHSTKEYLRRDKSDYTDLSGNSPVESQSVKRHSQIGAEGYPSNFEGNLVAHEGSTQYNMKASTPVSYRTLKVVATSEPLGEKHVMSEHYPVERTTEPKQSQDSQIQMQVQPFYRNEDNHVNAERYAGGVALHGGLEPQNAFQESQPVRLVDQVDMDGNHKQLEHHSGEYEPAQIIKPTESETFKSYTIVDKIHRPEYDSGVKKNQDFEISDKLNRADFEHDSRADSQWNSPPTSHATSIYAESIKDQPGVIEETPQPQHVDGRYPAAFSLTKAIMHSAKLVDRPSSNDISVNGQNLIPEVYEAFSRTNNDLKQRYRHLQKWAAHTVADPDRNGMQEDELREEVKNLNDLSSMVRLVNNLEKDMLKTILKRKQRLGARMGYKHQNIPERIDSKKRFRSPSDVQELLQYIYDTYIENRTADEIPVVLQAFQKSVTDIVSKKNGSSGSERLDLINGTSYLTKSIEALSAGPKLMKKSENSSTVDTTPPEYQYYDNQSDDFTKFAQQDRANHSLTPFVDHPNATDNPPLITVKLLKALDLFLDSIEIGRKIKRFRTKVEEIASEVNGSVVLTNGMRSSLGEINKEINETLIKSDKINKDDNDTVIPTNATSPISMTTLLSSFTAANANPTGETNVTTVEETKARHEPTSYQHEIHEHARKTSEVETRNPGLFVNDVDSEGISFDDEKLNVDNLKFERDWYTKNNFKEIKPDSRDNISSASNVTVHHYPPYVSHVVNGPHGEPYKNALLSAKLEEMAQDRLPANLTNLEKEAMKGHTYYTDQVDKASNATHNETNNPYDHEIPPYLSESNLTSLNNEAMGKHGDFAEQAAERLQNNTSNMTTFHEEVDYYKDSDALFTEKNLTALNKEAMKGDKYYAEMVDRLHNETAETAHEMFLESMNMSNLNQEAVNGEFATVLHANELPPPENDSFDKEVQKIIDHAIDEAKNSSDSAYEYPKMKKAPLINITKTLNKSNDKLKLALETHGVDKGAMKTVNNYLAEENKYIGGMFYEERGEQTNFTNLSRKNVNEGESSRLKTSSMYRNSNDHSWDKKTLPTHKNASDVPAQAEMQSETNNIVEGPWDKRDMDFHVLNGKDEPDDMVQIEHLRSLVHKLQEESLKEEESDDARFAKQLILSNFTNHEEGPAIHRVIIPKHYGKGVAREQNDEEDFAMKTAADVKNLDDLEKEISEIRKDKKTLEMVDSVVSGGLPVEVTGDKRDVYRKNPLSLTDRTTGQDFSSFFHRVNKRLKKRSSVRHAWKKKPRMTSHLAKRSHIPREKKHKRKHRQHKRKHKHGKRKHGKKGRRRHKWKKYVTANASKKSVIVSSKNKKLKSASTSEVSPSLKDVIIKDSFFNRLTEAQQKLVWEAVKTDWRKQHKIALKKNSTSEKTDGQEESTGKNSHEKTANASLKHTIKNDASRTANISTLQTQGNNSLVNQNLTLSTFASNHTENETLVNPENSTLSQSVTVNLTRSFLNESNHIIDSVTNTSSKNCRGVKRNELDPYSTICETVVQPPDEQRVYSHNSDVTPALLNPQGMPIHPNDVEALKMGKIEPNQDEPTNQGNASAQTITPIDEAEFRSDRTPGNQFYFKNKSQFTRSQSGLLELMRNIKHINETIAEFNVDTNYSSANRFKNNEMNITLPETKLYNKSNLVNPTLNLKNITSAMLENISNPSFDAPLSKIASNVPLNGTIINSTVDSSKKVCKGDYIVLKKGGFEYKIPTIKCVANEENDSNKYNSTINWLSAVNEVEQMNNESRCTPMYKSFADGNAEFKVQIGCKETADVADKSFPASKVANVTKTTNKLIYKAKNLEMTEDDKGSERIVVTSPKKTIEIDYPPENTTNGLIILKQGDKMYEIPSKNRSAAGKPRGSELPKSAAQTDYLQTTLNSSETFKVKDTSITKESYENGAKVITMEKEKATLSIIYPPKNDSSGKGYMILTENNRTYKIPLDGSKAYKLSNMTKSIEEVEATIKEQPGANDVEQYAPPQIAAAFEQPKIFSAYETRLTTDRIKKDKQIIAPSEESLLRRVSTPTVDDRFFSTERNKTLESTDDLMSLTEASTNQNAHGYQLQTQDGRSKFSDDNPKFFVHPQVFRHRVYQESKKRKHNIADNSKTLHLYQEEAERQFNENKPKNENFFPLRQSVRNNEVFRSHYQNGPTLGEPVHLTEDEATREIRPFTRTHKHHLPLINNYVADRERFNVFMRPVKTFADHSVNDLVHHYPDKPAPYIDRVMRDQTNKLEFNPILTGNMEVDRSSEGSPFVQHRIQNASAVEPVAFPPSQIYARNDQRQLSILKKMQNAADSAIDKAYRNVQKVELNHFAGLPTDKLDEEDSLQLRKFGYNPHDVNTINKQVIGLKRNLASGKNKRKHVKRVFSRTDVRKRSFVKKLGRGSSSRSNRQFFAM